MSRRKILSLFFVVTSLLTVSLWLFRKPVVVIGVAVNADVSSMAFEGRMLSVVQAYVMWHNNKTESRFTYRLETTVYDDPADSVSELKDRGAVVIIGYPLSSEALKVVDLAGEFKIPVVSPTCSSSYLSKKEDWFFRLVKDSLQEGRLMKKMLTHLGVRDIIVYNSSDNSPYVESLIQSLTLSEGEDISIVEQLSYPDSLNRQYGAAGAAVIISDSAKAFWTIQELHMRYPSMPVLLSRWSWISDLGNYRNIPGADFYINSPFDRVSGVRDPFVSFMTNYMSIELADVVFHTVASMKLLDQVFESDPGAQGQDLRLLLSHPRSIDFCDNKISLDCYGDAHSESSFYRYSENKVKEVSLR